MEFGMRKGLGALRGGRVQGRRQAAVPYKGDDGDWAETEM